jgi:hypothetical protein
VGGESFWVERPVGTSKKDELNEPARLDNEAAETKPGRISSKLRSGGGVAGLRLHMSLVYYGLPRPMPPLIAAVVTPVDVLHAVGSGGWNTSRPPALSPA